MAVRKERKESIVVPAREYKKELLAVVDIDLFHAKPNETFRYEILNCVNKHISAEMLC